MANKRAQKKRAKAMFNGRPVSYKILRSIGDEHVVIAEGLTKAEALRHVADPESSSQTCKSFGARARTWLRGPWFDFWQPDFG